MKRLLVPITCLFALFAGVLFLVGSSAQGRAFGDADRVLAERAKAIADALDHVLQQRMVQTFTFATLPSVRGFASSDDAGRDVRRLVANSELQSIVTADPNIRAATIVDASGLVVLGTDSIPNSHWGNYLFVRQALVGHLNASVPMRESGEFSQYYSAPILNNAGDVAGVLVVRVAAQEMWNSLGPPPGIVVVDDNGVRIADRSAKPQLLVALAPLTPGVSLQLLSEKRYGEIGQIPASNFPVLLDVIRQSDSANVTFTDSGRSIRAATQRIKTNRWTVIAYTDEEAILAPVREALWDQTKIAIAGCIIGMGVMYVVQRTMHGSRDVP